VRLLTKAGQLDMKIGSSDRVDEIFERGMAGLRFAHSPRPPRPLPSVPGLVYFQVDRASQREEWQNVQKALTLAIRLNANRILGDIQGQRVLTTKASNNQTASLQFSLYVLPQEQTPASGG
jgi:type VI secretion system protein ImpJ